MEEEHLKRPTLIMRRWNDLYCKLPCVEQDLIHKSARHLIIVAFAEHQ